AGTPPPAGTCGTRPEINALLVSVTSDWVRRSGLLPGMSDSSEVYYVVLRGAGRQPIFNDDEDRRHFTRVVAEAAAACGVAVPAHCWLQTEARLAAQVADVPIGQFAQYIADKHTRRLKRRIALTGSLFEQQYRGVPLDGRTELPDLVRHIHLAPLKAGLTD